MMHSMLWHCWFGVRKSIQPVKNWLTRCWCGYLSGVWCKWFVYGLAPAHPIRAGKWVVKWLYVCVLSKKPLKNTNLSNFLIRCFCPIPSPIETKFRVSGWTHSLLFLTERGVAPFTSMLWLRYLKKTGSCIGSVMYQCMLGLCAVSRRCMWTTTSSRGVKMSWKSGAERWSRSSTTRTRTGTRVRWSATTSSTRATFRWPT